MLYSCDGLCLCSLLKISIARWHLHLVSLRQSHLRPSGAPWLGAHPDCRSRLRGGWSIRGYSAIDPWPAPAIKCALLTRSLGSFSEPAELRVLPPEYLRFDNTYYILAVGTASLLHLQSTSLQPSHENASSIPSHYD